MMARKKKETLTLFAEVQSVTRKLTDAQFGQLMRAAFSYRFQGEVYDGPDPAVDMAFQFIQSQIDRYSESCATNAANARGAAKCSEMQRNSAECSDESENKQSDPPILSNPIHSNDIDAQLVACEIVNDPPKRPRQRGQTIVDSLSDFEIFWRDYPKKVGKTAAQKAFAKVQAPLNVLLNALERQKASQQWHRDGGQYIPNPATWLNQGRWEDEVPEVREGQPQSSRASYVPPNDSPVGWMEG